MNNHGDMSSTVTSTTPQIMDENKKDISEAMDTSDDFRNYENGIAINVEENLVGISQEGESATVRMSFGGDSSLVAPW
jgi:hypothetical protein